MRRLLLRLLLALPLAGCVIPTDPIRLAAQGPSTNAQVTAAGRGLAEGERIALVIRETQLDRDRLHRCITDGMRARLPAPSPAVVALDPASAARLSAVTAIGPTQALPEEMDGFGVEWAVLVRDASRASSDHRTRSVVEADIAGSGFLGGASERRTSYRLELEATILDTKARRRLGWVTAVHFTEGSSEVMAGLAVLGGLPVPAVLPIIRLPAGTSALAICNAFGRAIGDALVSATRPPAATEAGPVPPPS